MRTGFKLFQPIHIYINIYLLCRISFQGPWERVNPWLSQGITVGLRRVQPSVLFVIMIIPFPHLSPISIPPPPFHVSDLRFVSCFHSYSHFPFHSIFNPQARTPTLTYAPFSLPWYVLFGTYTFRSSCMFLSLKSTLIVPRTHHPNLRTLVCLSLKIRGQ